METFQTNVVLAVEDFIELHDLDVKEWNSDDVTVSAFLSIEGHGCGLWDGRYDAWFEDSDTSSDEFNEYVKSRCNDADFSALKDSMNEYAWQVWSRYEYDHKTNMFRDKLECTKHGVVAL
jgi:hypothetical protein